jgi:hypothetical protein
MMSGLCQDWAGAPSGHHRKPPTPAAALSTRDKPAHKAANDAHTAAQTSTPLETGISPWGTGL